ncbi:hypothetical protein [Denitromonas iodatirespirans]|uniref:Uncharacterized protein n=1 Tax=Denitromonas iodatirespirans TaxID=2795389 RepID=A0A944HA12_DENI1|nr:hypothetical protein [Denitromonas iodatirespirans]MBT0963010.1 hypothetical protein [Denitromonas iodatirespirans]
MKTIMTILFFSLTLSACATTPPPPPECDGELSPINGSAGAQSIKEVGNG